jgi:hypothetical protein
VLAGLEECSTVPPKYLRRLLTIPVIAVFGLVLLLGLPIWLTLALPVDAALNLRRLRCTRIVLFLVFVPWLELVSVLVGFGIWLRHFGQMQNPSPQSDCWVYAWS